MSPTLARVMTALCTGAVALLSMRIEAQTPSTPGPQRFEARADIVLVDVTVVDDRGQPVIGLRAEDFALEVEGQPRTLQSAQFVQVGAPAGAGTVNGPAQAREALASSNIGQGDGRLLLLAVDESRLQLGASRAVLSAAESLLEQLSPPDLVGLVRIPNGAGGVEFTTNRDAVRSGLRAITGQAGRQPGQKRIYLSEAHEFVNGTRQGWDEALRRECPPGALDGQVCPQLAEGEAYDVIRDHETRTEATLRFLDGLFGRLQPLNRPVNLVLISEGMYLGPNLRGMFDRTIARAATARISLHIVQPDQGLYDIRDRNPRPDTVQDRSLMREGVEELALGMRGGLFRAVAGGAGVFDRISRELSGYYLIGFEPTAEDRDGRVRRIRVNVRRGGVTVRSRSSFAVTPGEPVPATTTEADSLRQALMATLPVPGIPIRVATYQSPAAGGAQVRVLIGAEISRTQELGPTAVGLMIVDGSGRVVLSDAGEVALVPARAAQPSPQLYLRSVLLPAGDYTLRLAARGAAGQIGSVHHLFSARLRAAADGLLVSDLIVAGATNPAEGTRPTPSAVIDTDRAMFLLEGQHRDARSLAAVRVEFEILDGERRRPVMTVPAESQTRDDGSQRAFASLVDVTRLSTGEYVARARIENPGRPSSVIERPFRVERPAGRSAAPSAAAGPVAAAAGSPAAPAAAPPASFPVARLVLLQLRFTVTDVLRPEIVNPFLDHLQSTLQLSEAVRPALEQARRGSFELTPPGPGGAGDEVMRSFISGLAALRQGQLPQATTFFQRTLRGAPDFVGVAFFMGAVHAAAGRDRDAAGAWQLSLLSPEAAPAYPLLVDSLLRAGEAQRALDVIQRSPETFRTSPGAQEREVLVDVVAGRYAEAFPRLRSLLAERPADLDLLFTGIQTLYRLHLQEPLQGADLADFDAWTQRYQQRAGADRPSIASWRNAVVR